MILEFAASVLAFYALYHLLSRLNLPLLTFPGPQSARSFPDGTFTGLKDEIASGRNSSIALATVVSGPSLSLPPEIWLYIHRLATAESSPLAKASTDRFQYTPIRDPLEDMEDLLLIARSFVLVCRLWNSLATEILYENVRVDARFHILHASLKKQATARLVRSIRLSTIRYDHNYQILALCPQVRILVQPDEVSTSMRANFVTLDAYRGVDLPKFDFLRHVYCSKSLIASGLLHLVLRASPNLEHLFASSTPRKVVDDLPALPSLKTLGLPVLGRSASSFLFRIDLQGLTRLQCTVAHLRLPECPFFPSLQTLEIFGSGTTIEFPDISTKCPCLRELYYEIWNAVSPPRSGEQSPLSYIRLHSGMTPVRYWASIERHFEVFLSPEFPKLERVVTSAYC
ncbi:hypothetical protein B0H11DRAFT_2286851 [Mycena galericulata]|nr:hypothetical protein B0H11DRAFT_2286851 [Mycena galericulata]